MTNRFMLKFDAWLEAGPFRATDLAIYRIVYSVAAAASIPGLSWLHDFPSDIWQPPLGPMQLVPGLPSTPVLVFLEVALRTALILLAIGCGTRYMSILVGLLYIYSNGLIVSFGALNHYIMLGVVPLIMSFSNWGSMFSVDALLQQRFSARWNRWVGIVPLRQWPLRLVALSIGVTFFFSFLAKLQGGWLNPGLHATWDAFLRYYYAGGIHAYFGPLMAQLQNQQFWEALDWVTLFFEGALLVSVLRWTWFRLIAACLTLFHFSVLMLLNIAFASDVIAFGAFIIWPLVFHKRMLAASHKATLFWLVLSGLITAAIGFASMGQSYPNRWAIYSVVIIGALVGMSYLIRRVWLVLVRLR